MINDGNLPLFVRTRIIISSRIIFIDLRIYIVFIVIVHLFWI